jgi:hypothetical protein
VDVRYRIQGHRLRVYSLNLSQPWPEIAAALLDLLGLPAPRGAELGYAGGAVASRA